LTSIHPLACVSPDATLGQDVTIGPFCVIEAGAVIGDRCRILSHAIVKSATELGADCFVAEKAVLGGLPQHVNTPESAGRLVIGHTNTIREFATIHRSLYADAATRVGDHNLIMAGVHVAHDCMLGDHVVLTNNLMLGGHVEIGDRAFLSGGVAVHQFCRIGRGAMIGGYARIKKDVPPFVTVDDGTSQVVGLNLVGLRRAGFTKDDIRQLKQAYRVVYRQGLPWDQVVPTLRQEFPDGPAAEFHRFLSGGRRGFVCERRAPGAATIRLHRGDNEEPQVKAG